MNFPIKTIIDSLNGVLKNDGSKSIDYSYKSLNISHKIQVFYYYKFADFYFKTCA